MCYCGQRLEDKVYENTNTSVHAAYNVYDWMNILDEDYRRSVIFK